MAASARVGGAGGGVGFYFHTEFFHAGQVGDGRGKIRAAIAGGHRGIAEAAAAVRGIDGCARNAGGRPAKSFFTATGQRAWGVFDGLKILTANKSTTNLR